MYHGRFKNTHYQTGFDWGEMLRKHGNFIHEKHTFQITEERKKFAMQCLPVYEKYYPKVRKAGFNAGLLVRYLLEKCRTTEEAVLIKVISAVSLCAKRTKCSPVSYQVFTDFFYKIFL